MKIRKVKWNNHPILGNLELNFTDNNGTSYKNIILAGENGSGKTTVLETISTFLDNGAITPFEYIEYEANGELLKAVPAESSTIDSFYDIIDAAGSRHQMHTNRNNLNPVIDNNPQNIRFYGFALSKARSDYRTNTISSTTSKTLDASNKESDSSDDFSSLKQLLIDIQEQDNEEFAKWSDEQVNNGQSIDRGEFLENKSKMRRFKNAFNNFFEGIQFDKCVTYVGRKEVVFKKNGNDIGIDYLSTGEKQIVFRGTHLLQNINRINDTIVFVDEPEISMHPSWQNKILQYYQGLFTDSVTHIQGSQMIFATHSEYVISTALNDNVNNLVIVLKENGGAIISNNIIAPNVLSRITSAETNYVAFNIASIDYHIELFAHIQNFIVNPQHGVLSSIKQVDDYIINWHGYDTTQYNHPSSHKQPNGHTTNYTSLSVYIRNCIDHPGIGNYTDEELRKSIDLMIAIINKP